MLHQDQNTNASTHAITGRSEKQIALFNNKCGFSVEEEFAVNDAISPFYVFTY